MNLILHTYAALSSFCAHRMALHNKSLLDLPAAFLSLISTPEFCEFLRYRKATLKRSQGSDNFGVYWSYFTYPSYQLILLQPT